MAIVTNDKREDFVKAARSHVGYRTKTGEDNYFAGKVGYIGKPWNGAFVDVVARETGLVMPACVYTPTGMAEFMKLGRWRVRPQPGDIVFYTFATGNESFSQPHCGVVVDVAAWSDRGLLTAVEGQTDSGMPRQTIKIADGVYERVRSKQEIIGFGRPAYRRAYKTKTGEESIKIHQLRPAKGKRSLAIDKVQLALSITSSLRNATRGTWDGSTKYAYARWQRSIGYVGSDVTGMPDEAGIARLGRETGLFKLDA
jgi:hypothetical protein